MKKDKPERIYHSIEKNMKEWDIRAQYNRAVFPFDDNFIYFCDDRTGKIAIFYRNKKEVVWVYQVLEPREGIGQIYEMQVYENFWFILDRYDKLHVFEREKECKV